MLHIITEYCQHLNSVIYSGFLHIYLDLFSKNIFLVHNRESKALMSSYEIIIVIFIYHSRVSVKQMVFQIFAPDTKYTLTNLMNDPNFNGRASQ